MSDIKQSSVEWLVSQLFNSGVDTTRFIKEIEQAVAMHKEETVDLIVQYEIKHHLIFTEEGILNTVKKAEQYYNETYGGNNEQQ